MGPIPWANGQTRQVTTGLDTGVPVIATVEPDRDGDGYGDQTQDRCVEQPALHTACPMVHLLAMLKVFRGGIALEASTGDPARGRSRRPDRLGLPAAPRWS